MRSRIRPESPAGSAAEDVAVGFRDSDNSLRSTNMNSFQSSPMSRRSAARTTAAFSFATLFALAGCSGGGSDPNAVPGTSGDFVVLRTEPANNGRLFLNESISIDFSNRVDLDSADLNTVAFQVFDLNGTALTEQPQGNFELDRTPGDADVGRRLKFSPLFPTNDTFDNGGFRPGRRYIVQLVSGEEATTLRDGSDRQRPLAKPASFEFTTADGTTPFELFRDTLPGGPRRTGFSVSQGDPSPLSLLGHAAVEVRLSFNQPLNPSTVNIPTNLDPDPTRRIGTDKGRIFMQYDDAETGETDIWIPATVELESNTLSGSTVVLRPIGILPNNATVTVIVQSTVEDMSGESNISDTAYSPDFAKFTTQQLFDPQYDAIVERFIATNSTIDLDAPILEPLAAIQNGQLSSTFNFDGQPSTLDYEPAATETILDTNFTQVAPLGSEPINVAGGIFRFRNVTIPAGRIVRGVGPNPMVWLVTGNFEVNGRLSVDGGDGGRVDVLNSANFPTPGGIGVCGGGNGGRGSPNSSDRSIRGENGFGPGQRPNDGGVAGEAFCGGGSGACTGAGAGGGSFSTQGDPEFNDGNDDYDQWLGPGGSRCAAVTGAPSGDRPFTDSRDDNDFWGDAVNVAAGVRVRGELLMPQGGAGGGGGGDKAPNCTLGTSGFISDEKGGGGGAGAGVLIIQALGTVIIGPQGHISANGGNGGGGEQAGSNNRGGGGGGGSGGLVVIMAAGGLDIEKHGDPYVDDDIPGGSNDFAITADGGIGEQGEFQDEEIADKYQGYNSNFQINSATGGFGGMGVVQILVQPNDEDADNTGSKLDDSIVFRNNGGVITDPAERIRMIGWRGWADESGNRIDDFGNPITALGDGDIRPAPILMPLPFGARSRAQSRWIDLGAVARRSGGNPGPNYVNSATEPQPDYEFGGVRTSTVPDACLAAGDTGEFGYADWDTSGNRVIPVVVGAQSFSNLQANQTFNNSPAFRMTVVSPELAAQPANRYAHYRAELLNGSNSVVADFRLLGHTTSAGATDLFLDANGTIPSDATQVRIVQKFYNLTTDGQIGLGSFDAVNSRPRSNVRVGFAFHVDPTIVPPTGQPDLLRYPREGFSSDVACLRAAMAAAGHRPTYVKWDVLFDQRFSQPSAPIVPNMPSQSLDDLVLPFRF